MASRQRQPDIRRSAGWQVLAASFTILMVAFSFALFSLPIFYPFLRRTYGWNAAQASAGGSIVLLLIGVLGPIIGRLTDRFTPKKVLLTGMCIGGTALALLSTISPGFTDVRPDFAARIFSAMVNPNSEPFC